MSECSSSVPYQFLMAFYLNPTILSFSSFFSTWLTGMDLLSSGCIQILLWNSYRRSPELWATECVNSRKKPVPSSKCANQSVSRLPRCGSRQKNMAMAKTKSNSLTHGNVRQQKEFNLKIYKFHALGGYCSTIWCFRTTDSYSTQPVG